MQPKIIVSQNPEERSLKIWQVLEESKIKENNPDLLLIEDEKISIKIVKEIVKHLSTKPFGKTGKSVVILNGNDISLDAQNALLKTLEEPPEDAVILIGVDAENKLLSTILSRCLVLNYQSRITNNESAFDIDDLINKSVEERFEVIEKTDDKQKFLKDLTASYRAKTLKGESDGKFLEELLNAEIWNESNVNIRTILEYLMLKLPSD